MPYLIYKVDKYEVYVFTLLDLFVCLLLRPSPEINVNLFENILRLFFYFLSWKLLARQSDSWKIMRWDLGVLDFGNKCFLTKE